MTKILAFVRTFCILLCFFVTEAPTLVLGQGADVRSKVDRLIARLPTILNDSSRVDTLNEISFKLSTISPYEGIKYGEQALELADRLKLGLGSARANSALGANYFSASDFPNAYKYWLAALKTHEQLGNTIGIANHLHNIGNIFFSQKDYAKALDYYSRGLEVASSAGLKNFKTNSFTAIGNVYLAQKEFNKAIDFHSRALELDRELGNKSDIASDLMNIGEVYTEEHHFEEALSHFKQALALKKEAGQKTGIAKAFNLRGRMYLSMSRAGIATTENAHNAVKYLDSAIAIDMEIGYLDNLQSSYQYLAEAHELLDNYKEAHGNYKRFYTIKDSIFSNEKQRTMSNHEKEAELERKQRELDHMKEVEDRKLQRQRLFTYAGFAGVLLMGIFSMFIVRERKRAESERKKSDDLLLNILPHEIAGELKINGVTKARHFDNVTVLFTDFVNFTKASEKMSPQELIDELHECFTAFDEITARYHIEKIKTIGDAYLAVSGLPVPHKESAENAVRAALEICTFMENRVALLGSRTFAIRIGIHTGSVVAGVVGKRKFAYDVWGDTVNTAARMEQHGEAGKVNISQVTFDLISAYFNCTYRGEIAAKNKGSLKMYFVDKEKA